MILFSVFERKAELAEQRVSLLVSLGRRNERNLHAEDLGDLVDVDLREDDLLGDAEGVVALTVELLVDTLEVADTGQSHGDQTLQELVHLRVAQRHAHADGHALAQLEVGDVLACERVMHGFLARDLRQLGARPSSISFLSATACPSTLIDDDLRPATGTCITLAVTELLHKGGLPPAPCTCVLSVGT